MSKPILLTVIALIIVVGGLVYVVKKDNSSETTVPTQEAGDNTNTTTSPQATLPVAITSSSMSISDNGAIVSGTVTPNGAFTTYWYEYGGTSNLGSKTANQTIGSGFVAIQAPGYIVDLVKNTTYYFRLVAENQYGKTAGNQLTFKTTTNGIPSPVGALPTAKTISASTISKTSADINGEVTPNKATTQYWFEYGKTTELGSLTAFSGIGDGSVKVPVSISLSDLLPKTTYYFRLNAQNQFGTINGSILNFKTK